MRRPSPCLPAAQSSLRESRSCSPCSAWTRGQESARRLPRAFLPTTSRAYGARCASRGAARRARPKTRGVSPQCGGRVRACLRSRALCASRGAAHWDQQGLGSRSPQGGGQEPSCLLRAGRSGARCSSRGVAHRSQQGLGVRSPPGGCHGRACLLQAGRMELAARVEELLTDLSKDSGSGVRQAAANGVPACCKQGAWSSLRESRSCSPSSRC